VYQRYADEFGDQFGKTVHAIFTDEPALLGRPKERNLVPGTTGILEHVNAFLGYDFEPHLPALWYDDEPEADRYRQDYGRAIQARLEQTYYQPIYDWCDAHGIALTGHPAEPDAIGQLRYFHIEPEQPSALEGKQSTQAKCASSSMLHMGRRRNTNEFCGAYGPDMTFEEMQWLAHWLLVRGCNLLMPHAFYYSVRGPRVDERPPDVGPNSPWWARFKPFAGACRRLCWLNTDSQHVCSVAILGRSDDLPWRAAKVCLERQRDFNYLEARHLWEDAQVSGDGVRLRGVHYRALIVEGEPPEKAVAALETLEQAGRVLRWQEGVDEGAWIEQLDRLAPPDVSVRPASPGLRVRHVIKEGMDYYVLFNEAGPALDVRLALALDGKRSWLDAETGEERALGRDAPLHLNEHACRVLAVRRE
jgi:hypothetical protein